MKIRDVMTKDVVTAAPTEKVPEVARRMSERGISSMVVVEGEKVIGIVTERDFLERLLAKGKNSTETTIGEIMSVSLVTVDPEANILQGLRLMRKNRYSQLPVVQGGRLVGIVALSDLMLFLSTFFSAESL